MSRWPGALILAGGLVSVACQVLLRDEGPVPSKGAESPSPDGSSPLDGGVSAGGDGSLSSEAGSGASDCADAKACFTANFDDGSYGDFTPPGGAAAAGIAVRNGYLEAMATSADASVYLTARFAGVGQIVCEFDLFVDQLAASSPPHTVWEWRVDGSENVGLDLLSDGTAAGAVDYATSKGPSSDLTVNPRTWLSLRATVELKGAASSLRITEPLDGSESAISFSSKAASGSATAGEVHIGLIQEPRGTTVRFDNVICAGR